MPVLIVKLCRADRSIEQAHVGAMQKLGIELADAEALQCHGFNRAYGGGDRPFGTTWRFDEALQPVYTLRNGREHRAQINNRWSLVISINSVARTIDEFGPFCFQHLTFDLLRFLLPRPREHVLLDKIRVILPDQIDKDGDRSNQRRGPQVGRLFRRVRRKFNIARHPRCRFDLLLRFIDSGRHEAFALLKLTYGPFRVIVRRQDPIEQSSHRLFFGDLARQRVVTPHQFDLLLRLRVPWCVLWRLHSRHGATEFEAAPQEFFGGDMSLFAEGSKRFEQPDRLRDDGGE
ncbi:BQ5605_C029g10651 [Microbotryum silenes-dioicae]|uniref:BQ5605_C029g10651 protein n=1 Tax=Microbotryum silenes-dioicae TaxID=796604 RepID=A0A2X0MN31_9BASI|nr:BQ5605_C029g10651 [Microbotryum silenes-dioicae]